MSDEQNRKSLNEASIPGGAPSKAQYASAARLKNKRVDEMIKEIKLGKDFHSIITVEMAIELSDILHIPDSEAFALLIAFSHLIKKRVLEGKVSVINNVMSIYPRKIKRGAQKGKINVYTRTHNAFLDDVRKQFIVPVERLHNKDKERIVNSIINKISSNKRIGALLSVLFGYPDYDVFKSSSDED